MAMTKAEYEEAKRQLAEDDRARQDKAHGSGWKSGQTIDTTDGKGNQR